MSTTPVDEPAATNPNEESALLPVGTTELEIVDVRHGMFHGSGDTSGYAGLVRPVALPSATPRPYGGWYDEAADTLASVLPDYAAAVDKVVVEHGDLTFHVRREHLVDFVRALRDDPALRFEMCASVSGVHYPHETGRELHAVYAFLSLTHNRRLRLEVTCPDEDSTIPSIMGVYPTADWHERETFDFFGIVFTDRPDLTRIQMPDDWPGSPAAQGLSVGRHPGGIQGR